MVMETQYTLLELMRHKRYPLLVKHGTTRQMWEVVGFYADGTIIGWAKTSNEKPTITFLDKNAREWIFLATVGAEQ